MRTLLIAALFALGPAVAGADEMPVYKLVAKDGVFDPVTLEVAAGKKFKIEISNEGKGPMEFESKDLKQEKVLAPGAKSSVVVNGLKPGTYTFFDEYKPDALKGKIVAK
ncbi:MAG TPA: cupredoxin domain-containing protein [Casimicrobiaceae bacterium]|nr:cupredoxin domain-containing protein [Casimicrobiaceae bacterium]